MRKFQSDYPGWSITRSLHQILEEMVASQRTQLTLSRT
jgi:hypothetical protein